MITEKLRHEISEMVSLKRKPIIEGWTTQEKAEVLASLVIDFKPQLLVEVGIFGGRSLFAQAFALRENGMGLIWGIDPWSLDAALEGEIGEENKKWWSENVNLEDIYVGFIKAVLDLQLTKQIRWIRERGEIVSKLFQKQTIDVLHLDSNHSELCSCRDVGIWHSKVKPGGFLIVDDVSWSTVAKSLTMIRAFNYKTIFENSEFIVFRKPE
jgi:predicted O-methyltransferase YrrM